MDALLGRTLVLVAHADDETVGSGMLVQRMRDPIVVFATDSAPRDEYFWRGYPSRQSYAALRRREADQALNALGIRRMDYLASSSFVDMELFRHVPEALDALSHILRRYHPDAILTPAYEGGHPDHDTCNFIASVAAVEFGIGAWEMPLYHSSADSEFVPQHFIETIGDEVTPQFLPEELARKRCALAAYKSQSEILSRFVPEVEQFRPMPRHDYSLPPHPFKLTYEHWQWPITGADLCFAFSSFAGRDRQKKSPAA
jgi:LmbE family N-acetylglucosaminyl deacetylase